jgi:probable rRNA maturation factor
MPVLIDNRQSRKTGQTKKTEQAAKTILSALGCPDAELSVLLVDDTQIAVLNKEYLGRTGPTNVIAFPMQEGPFGDITPDLLGDVVISVETSDREANGGGIPPEERFLELLIHGILHLLGYDHENDEAEAARMEKKTRELMAVVSGVD